MDPHAFETLEFVAKTEADELIVVAHIYDHQARLRSYELAMTLGQPAHAAASAPAP